MMITNGFGAVLGSKISGWMIQNYYTSADGVRDWHGIWLVFAIYALIIGVLFLIFFKHKHDPDAITNTHPQPLVNE